MPINYSTVITKQELELLSEKEYQDIKFVCEAKIKAEKDMSYYSSTNDNKLLKSYEFAFRNRIFENESYSKKVLISANLLYPNNSNLINILLSRNITYKTLSTIINKVDRIKSLALLKDEYELDEHTTISDKNLNTICNLIRKYYSYDDQNLIIAKLVEIVVFDKELYLTLEGGPQKIMNNPYSRVNHKK